MSKYVIIKTEINHKPDTKVILLDNWFWHENFMKDCEIHSAGFFVVERDIYDRYGFRVICSGESKYPGDYGCKPGDAELIKSMLLR